MFIGTVITILVSIMILMMREIFKLERELKQCETRGNGGLKVKLLRKIKSKYDYYFIKHGVRRGEIHILNKRTGKAVFVTMYSWKSNIENVGGYLGISKRLRRIYINRADSINFYSTKNRIKSGSI